MPELRWTLLILGALFIGALALWELRRQRHARGPGHNEGHNEGQHQDLRYSQGAPARDGERISPTFDGSDPPYDASRAQSPARGVFREPTLTLPDMHLDGQGELRERAPISDPRVVELDDESLAGLKVDSQTAVDEFSASARDERDEEESRPVEPMIPELVAADFARPAADAPQLVNAPESDEPAGAYSDEHDTPTTQYRVSATAPDPQPAAPMAADSFAVAEPVVDWPDEDSRKIIALRLVSGVGERFAGRAVRLALAAEGFLIGKFEIFHKPGPDARAVLSAASLTKPGTFSLGTMDAQRFGGLSLFAVLPGPLSPIATFDELLTTARALNDRLRGALQDERGEPLTPMRSASIRDSLTAAATAAAPVVGAASAHLATQGPGGAGST
jgi:cell division protein ZipA